MTALSSADALPVLRSTKPQQLACKRFYETPQGWQKLSAPDIGRWRWSQVPVSDLDSLEAALRGLAQDPQAIVVRGALQAGVDPTSPIRRTLKKKPATFQDTPRRWMLVDIDELEPPEWWPGPGVDRERDLCLAWRAIERTLPEVFHGAAAIVRFSSSAGLEKNGASWEAEEKGKLRSKPFYSLGRGKVRLHLWFWLSRAVTSETLLSWAKFRGIGEQGVDLKLFNPIQIHFTAAPLWFDRMAGRVADPLGACRMFRLEGEPDVPFGGEVLVLERFEAEVREEKARRAAELAALRAERLRRGVSPDRMLRRFEGYGRGTVRGMFRNLAADPRHNQLLSAACRLAAMIQDGRFGLDEGFLGDLAEVAIAAGKGARGAYRAVEWGQDRPDDISELVYMLERDEGAETRRLLHQARRRAQQEARRPGGLDEDPQSREWLAESLGLSVCEGFAEGAPCPECGAPAVGYPLDPQMQIEGTCVGCGWRGSLQKIADAA